jgi:diacylglycerol O-acyltransferase / wax synthase
VAIAIMSYNGKIDFGLLADYDAMEDVNLIAEGIEAEVKQLLEAADASEKRTSARKQKQGRRKEPTDSGQATTSA